jgi:hypothetical protein
MLKPLTAAIAALAMCAAAHAQECVAPVWGAPVGPQWVEDSGGKLFAAGSVGAQAWGVARLDPEGWTQLPGEFDGRVRAIASNGDEVWVGGEFTSVDGLPTAGVALYDGTTWQPLGTGIDGASRRVNAVELYGGELYVGGNFSTAGGVNSPNLARYSAGLWSAVDAGLDAPVNDLALYKGELVVGGEFTDAGGLGLASAVSWDGALFAPLGPTGPAARRSLGLGQRSARRLGRRTLVDRTRRGLVPSGEPAGRRLRWPLVLLRRRNPRRG